MTPTEIVLLVLRIEAIVLGIILLVIFGYAIWSRSTRASRERRLSMGRAIIATHLESRQLPPKAQAELAALSGDDLRQLFHEVAPSVGEVERAWLRQIASRLGVLDAAIGELESGEWYERLWAARLLTLLDAEPTIMHRLLRDENEHVRAQGAAYVAQHPTRDGIHALIVMLSDRAPICRFTAKDALMRLGSAATQVLTSRLRNPNDPDTIAMLEVASVTASHEYMAAAGVHLDSPLTEVRLLVARLLRGIGGPESAEQLVRLTSDSSPKVREATVEAIGYLNHWTASGRIAKLLDDPESRVRLSAALALDRLGPTGELLLRRAKTKGSEHAAAAASRILDDPSRAGTGALAT